MVSDLSRTQYSVTPTLHSFARLAARSFEPQSEFQQPLACPHFSFRPCPLFSGFRHLFAVGFQIRILVVAKDWRETWLLITTRIEKRFGMNDCLEALELGYDDLLKGDSVYRPSRVWMPCEQPAGRYGAGVRWRREAARSVSSPFA